MDKKFLTLIILSVLLLSGLNVNALGENISDKSIKILSKSDSVSFSQTSIETKGEYISLNIAEANSFSNAPGKPMIPIFYKTYEFPMGTIIKDVTFSISEVKQQTIASKIQPVSQPLPLISIGQSNKNNIEKTVEDASVYSSSDLYPNEWCSYSVSCGLKDGVHKIFLTTYNNLVRYSPKENKIFTIDTVDVEISYELGDNPIPSEKTYDMVIIAPRKFYFSLIPLKNHKNSVGVETTIKTTESIYREYPSGRDKPEKIKLFIKDAIEKWGITYVLLVGGRNHQGFSFNVPVRYSNLNDRGYWNETYVSDLYYADIYNATGEFDDWDSNNNNIFAEWTFIWDPESIYWIDIDKKDIMDLNPDVYVGRLACNNIFELKTVVNKIINYEKTAYGQEWFKHMIVVGGDTVPGVTEDIYYEGELENQRAESNMSKLGYKFTELWTSNNNLTGPGDVVNAINNGAGFIYLSGHGTPSIWSTHPSNNENIWIDGLYIGIMDRLQNGNQLPICIVSGCHNSQFDVGFPNMLLGLMENKLSYFTWLQGGNCFGKMTWIKNCWSWNLIIQKNGGSIATIGNSGLGWTVDGSESSNYLDGWVCTRFFENYTEQSLQGIDFTLGMIHGNTIRNYIMEFEPNNDGNEKDRKTVEQWILLGDPSLKIGGYPQS